MKTKVIINIIVVMGLLSIVVGKLYSNKQQQKDRIALVEKSKQSIPVIVSTVTYDNIPFSFYERGTFEPASQITILSESQGRVISTNVVPGQTIRKGDILATLENKFIEYQLAISEAAYKKAQKDYDRYKNLTPEEAISTSQMEDASLALENAKNSFLIMKKQLEDLRVTAPITGKISKKHIETGALLMQGTPTFDIVSTDKMKFTTSLSDNELFLIQKNRAQIMISTESNYNEFVGKISSVDQMPTNSGRYKVDIELIGVIPLDILNGKIGKATFSIVSDEKSLVIDRKCIVGSFADAAVYLVKDNKAIFTKVTIGNSIGDKAFITSGLSDGDQVVVSGQINLNDGETVNVTNK